MTTMSCANERARTQWQFGDWEALSSIEIDNTLENSEVTELALLRAIGLMQLGQVDEAVACFKDIHLRLSEPIQLAEILISGLYNTLGRAAILLNQQDHAIEQFGIAVKIACPGSDTQLISQARISTQLAQLGIPYLWQKHTIKAGQTNVTRLLEQAKTYSPCAPELLIALAESEQRMGKFDQAIRYWQQLAAVQEYQMPQAYYDRLSQAYQQQKNFPQGTPEEEFLKGDGDKHQLLSQIHEQLKPDFYLEIGVQTGKSLALATCEALGIDPMPQLKSKLGPKTTVLRSTSDEFFAKQADIYIPSSPDLVFIDGMHLFEHVLRDFINVERYASPTTLVVIDDIYPCHPAQAERDRRTRAWTGDVWKLLVVLQRYRRDLMCCALDAYPTGLLLVTNLDASSTVLRDSYDEILHAFRDLTPSSPPDDILLRKQAFSCKEGVLESFIDKLNIRKYGATLRIGQ